jgi:biotin carboxylase
MEIGARLGGDFISTELTYLSSGIDMVAAAINVALGVEPTLTPTSEQHGVAIRYFTPTPGRVVSIMNIEAMNRAEVYASEIYVKLNDEIREVKSSIDRSGHVIVSAGTAKDAIEIAESIIETVNIGTI